MFKTGTFLLRFNFCFRFRKEWQSHILSKHQSLHSFTSKLSKMQSQLIPSQKLILFQLLSKKNKLIQQLINNSPPIATSLANTPTNWYLFNEKNRMIKESLGENSNQNITLDKISQQVQELSKHLNIYLEQIKQFLANKQMVDKVRRRLMLLEEGLSKIIIHNYSQSKQNISFQSIGKKTKFKEDAMYKITDLSLEQISKIADILVTFSNFGAVSKKLLLIVQMILQKYSEKMGDEIYKFMYVMAHNKAGVKVIEDQVMRRIKSTSQQNLINNVYCLYYLILNQIDEYDTMSQIVKKINSYGPHLQQYNIIQVKLIHYLQKWIEVNPQKFPPIILSPASEQYLKQSITKFYQIPSSQEEYFVRFITKQLFKFKRKTDQFFYKPCYVMSHNIFFFMDLREVNMGNAENGLIYLAKDYYKFSDIKIKMISASQTNKTETRRKEVEYFWSKVKKESRSTKQQGPLFYEY